MSISLGAGVDASVLPSAMEEIVRLTCMHAGGKGRVQKGHRLLNRLELPRSDSYAIALPMAIKNGCFIILSDMGHGIVPM